MADYTNQDVDQLIRSLKEMSSGWSKQNGNSSYKNDAEYTNSTKKLSAATKGVTNSFSGISSTISKTDKDFGRLTAATLEATRETANLVRNFKSVAAWTTAFVGAGTAVVNSINESLESYREMSNIGQTFSGSMLNMHMAAAEAVLPLEDFAKLMKQNSSVIATTGVKGFSDMGASLRSSLKEFGMLNLTTQDLNEYLTEYSETQRLSGTLQGMSVTRAVDSMKNLAMETTKLSELTGKNRLDIMRQSQAAQRDASFTATMMMNAGNNAEFFAKAAGSATTYLAAMPGDTGQMLSTMLTQTIGRGSAEYTESFAAFNEVGMGGIASLMNNLSNSIKSGTFDMSVMDKFRSELDKMGNDQLPALRYAMTAGGTQGQAAAKVMEMLSSLSSIRGKNLSKELTEQEAMTRKIMNVQQGFAEITSKFRSKFYTSVDNILQGFDNPKNKAVMDDLSKAFEQITSNVGTFLEGAFSPENMRDAGQAIAKFSSELGKTILVVKDVLGALFGIVKFVATAFAPLIAAVGAAATWFDKITGDMTPLSKGLIALGVAVTGMIAYTKIKEKLGETFNIGGQKGRYDPDGSLRVRVVNPIGGGVGGGGGGSRGNPGRGSPRPSRMAGAMKGGIASVAVGGAGMLLDSLPDFAGKGLLDSGLNIANFAAMGAMIGSVIPVAGTAVGAVVGALLGGTMELVKNWDTVSNSFVTNVTALGGTVRSSLSAVGAFTKEMGSDIATGVSAITSTLGGALSSVGDSFGTLFSWAKEKLTPDSNDVSKILETLPTIDSGAGSTSPRYATVSGVITKPISEVVKMDPESMNTQLNLMQASQITMAKENAELRSTLNKLLNVMIENGAVLKAGTIEQIQEIRSGNRSLRDINSAMDY